jgi:hypothetical protein
MPDAQYDVALAFAAEDRAVAAEIARALSKHGVSVFYDAEDPGLLWGKNLHDHLSFQINTHSAL